MKYGQSYMTGYYAGNVLKSPSFLVKLVDVYDIGRSHYI